MDSHRPCDILFFDFDGVLADSVTVKTVAFGKLFEEHGEAVREKVVAHHLANGGMSRFDKFRHYYEAFLGKELGEEGMRQLCDRFSALVVDEVVASAEIPGAGDFLETWAHRIPCYVVSATPHEEIRSIVERRGMAQYFQDVLGAPVKKADHVHAVLDATGADPARCLFIGDAMSDLRAAETCGVPFLGVVPEEGSALIEARPDIRSVRDLRQMAVLPEFQG